MSRLVKFAKQVLSHLEVRIQDLRNTLKETVKETDDTVEAQAKTFRIWMWSSAAGLTLIVIASVVSMSGKTSTSDSQAVTSGRDLTMLESLPDGFVIAPIDPTNVDSLDSIFDEHGYADLYQSGTGDSRGKCIARGLPLVRAPKNRRRFAVLVPDEQASVLAELNEPVLVILRKKPLQGKDASRKRTPGESPLIREIKGRIDLIQEDIPEIAQTPEPGARS